MSELKFQVGDVVRNRDCDLMIIERVTDRYVKCTNAAVFNLEGKWSSSYGPHRFDIIEILGNISDFARLKQLEQALEQALDLIQSANSTDFGHTHGQQTYPQSPEWVNRAKNEVLPQLEAALAKKGGDQ